jgi:hypothetical protein
VTATPQTPRLSLGPLLAAGGGLLLFISSFIAWVGNEGTDETLNAWKIFDFMDIVLLLVALVTIAFAVLQILPMAPGLPVRPAEVVRWTGLIAVTIVFYTLIEIAVREDNTSEFGIWLAFLSSIAILAGAVIGDRFPLGAAGPRPAAGVPLGATPPTQTGPTPAAGQAAPDWYPDPRGQARLRYWDGTQWTDQTAD